MLRTQKRKIEQTSKESKKNIDNLFQLITACRRNAQDLIEEAEILHSNGRYSRAFSLAYTANEEVSKGQIVADYISNVTSKAELNKAFKNHDIKAAYLNLAIEVGPIIKTGKTEKQDDNHLPVFVQDNTLHYDLSLAQQTFVARNRSLYVDFGDKYVPVTPADTFEEEDAKKMIDFVKDRLNHIYFAEELNGRIGTKALIK